MTEPVTAGTLTGLRSAGGMIREARKAQGVHIGALAAAIKVSQHKLELLEADRFDELPDATFVRALAQTVCRSLKLDPQPVLAQLPQPAGHRLDQISEGINTPFRDRPGRYEPREYWLLLASPAVWGPALVLLAALALYLTPAGVLTSWTQSLRQSFSRPPAGDAAAPLPPAGAASSSESLPVVETVHSAPPRSADAPAAVGAALGASGAVGDAAGGATLQLRANAESWVEVVDAKSRTLISRMLQPGETLALEGALPLRLKVGNAAGTEATFRGRTLDLVSATRDNVVRMELK